MPFVLHPSGYCVYYHAKSEKNLKPGEPCLWCKRVAGHKTTCPLFVEKENECKSSRVKMLDRSAVLWARAAAQNNDIKFFTFTLPSIEDKRTFQKSAKCLDTGDLAVTAKFSKLLESVCIDHKRHLKEKLSYVWVSEAQMERHAKYGGIGDIHFHLVTDSFLDVSLLRYRWNNLLDTNSASCVHLDVINPVDKSGDMIRTLPNYLAKYMGKGSQRRILSRRFGCSRDLSRYVPITFPYLPKEVTCEKESHFTTPKGFEVSLYYFNTQEVLELYGADMLHQGTIAAPTVNDPNFTGDQIQWRAMKRAHGQATKEIEKELIPLFVDCPF